jgi:hypothetical protein
MIKAKSELFNGGASVQLSLKGTTKDLLLELKALCVGALSSMEFPKIDGREATLDERIEILCELLCEEDEDDGEQED